MQLLCQRFMRWINMLRILVFFGFFGKMANSSEQILPIFLSIKQRCIFFMHYVGGRHDEKAAPLTRRFGCSRAMPDSSMHP
jgi:hypothetical protein